MLVFVNLSPQLVEDLFFSTAHQLRPGAPQCSRGPIFQFLQENSRETGTDFRREYLDFFAMGGQGQAAAVLDAMAQELTVASTGYGFRIQGLLLELFAVLEDPGRYSLERIRVDARSEEFLYPRVARYLEAHHGRATREELGELLLLLANVWLNPMIYPATPEQTRRRMALFDRMLRSMGLNLLDEELLDQWERYCRLSQERL